MRAGQEVFSQRQTTSSSSRSQRAAADRARRRHHPRLRESGRSQRSRIGSTTFGITSPAFSMMTRSPSRMSLRATSCALCSVAIEIVEPARNTGSSTANGVTAPVRPTLTSIRSSRVCACCAGNLKAIAQRGNFAVAPSRSRSARSSSLMTTPSVSNGESWRAVRPLVAERDAPRRCRRSAASAARPAAPRRAQRRRACRLCEAARGSGGPHPASDELIRERAQAAPRDQRRVERSASSRRRRCADSRTAARRPLRAPCSCARTTRAAGTPRRALRCAGRDAPRSAERDRANRRARST